MYESILHFRRGISSGSARTKLKKLFVPLPNRIEPQTESVTLNDPEGKLTTAPYVENKIKKEVERIEEKGQMFRTDMKSTQPPDQSNELTF